MILATAFPLRMSAISASLKPMSWRNNACSLSLGWETACPAGARAKTRNRTFVAIRLTAVRCGVLWIMGESPPCPLSIWIRSGQRCADYLILSSTQQPQSVGLLQTGHSHHGGEGAFLGLPP